MLAQTSTEIWRVEAGQRPSVIYKDVIERPKVCSMKKGMIVGDVAAAVTTSVGSLA